MTKFSSILFSTLLLNNIAIANDNIQENEFENSIDNNSKLRATAGISLEIADPRFSRFGLFVQVGKSKQFSLVTGLKYGYGESNILMSELIQKEPSWLRLTHSFIISIPITINIYILSSNFHILIGPSFDTLISEPYAELFKKSLSELTQQDCTEQGFSNGFWGTIENLKDFNRFRVLFEVGLGYDFDLGIEMALSLNFPITKFTPDGFHAGIEIGGYYKLGFDIVKIIESINKQKKPQ